MHTNNARNPWKKQIKRKLAAPQGRGPGRPGSGPGSQAQTGGAASLRFIVFLMCFLHFGYAYALIGLEINIRLDLISNICVIIPNPVADKNVDKVCYRLQHTRRKCPGA